MRAFSRAWVRVSLLVFGVVWSGLIWFGPGEVAGEGCDECGELRSC